MSVEGQMTIKLSNQQGKCNLHKKDIHYAKCEQHPSKMKGVQVTGLTTDPRVHLTLTFALLIRKLYCHDHDMTLESKAKVRNTKHRCYKLESNLHCSYFLPRVFIF